VVATQEVSKASVSPGRLAEADMRPLFFRLPTVEVISPIFSDAFGRKPSDPPVGLTLYVNTPPLPSRQFKAPGTSFLLHSRAFVTRVAPPPPPPLSPSSAVFRDRGPPHYAARHKCALFSPLKPS